MKMDYQHKAIIFVIFPYYCWDVSVSNTDTIIQVSEIFFLKKKEKKRRNNGVLHRLYKYKKQSHIKLNDEVTNTSGVSSLFDIYIWLEENYGAYHPLIQLEICTLGPNCVH